MDLKDKLDTRHIKIKASAFFIKYYFEENGHVQYKEAYKCHLCERFITDRNDLWPCTHEQTNTNKCRDCAHKEYTEMRSKN